jgi:hypothetical protein
MEQQGVSVQQPRCCCCCCFWRTQGHAGTAGQGKQAANQPAQHPQCTLPPSRSGCVSLSPHAHHQQALAVPNCHDVWEVWHENELPGNGGC